MINEQLTLDDIITKTLDALEGAGLKNTTLWSYSSHYSSLRIFFRQHESRGYDLSLIEAFLAENEERYRNGEIAHYYHTHLKRSIKILVEYEAGGTLPSVFERKGTRFTLNEEFESILSEYLSENTFHPNTQDDIVWAIRRFMYFLEQSGQITQSMNSAGGRCHDNARCESMWARMKEELFYSRGGSEIYSVEELKHIIWVYYMSYWNNRRICHSICGLPPAVKRKRYLDAANVAAG